MNEKSKFFIRKNHFFNILSASQKTEHPSHNELMPNTLSYKIRINKANNQYITPHNKPFCLSLSRTIEKYISAHDSFQLIMPNNALQKREKTIIKH